MNYSHKKLSSFLIFVLICCIAYRCLGKQREYFSNNNKICCLYAYYEKNDIYKNNFLYFLENGILEEVDYYIVINGKHSLDINKINRKNIKVFERENIGYDFGAYSYVLKQIENSYDYYFFINTSVIGPYLRNNKKWTESFIELFRPEVKVVGTTINIHKQHYNKNNIASHVQSMFFCIDNEYLTYLKKLNFFDEDEINKLDFISVILKKEIELSQIAIRNGWNINCIADKYIDLDYRKITQDINNTSKNGDPYFKNAFFGKSIDKYDVIFFKNTRFAIN